MTRSPSGKEPGDLLSASAVRIADAIANRDLSCVEVVRAHLSRIEAVNGVLNAVVAMATDRALRDAEEADRELARGRRRGPLHGVPVTIKDSFDTEGLVSTAGTTGRRNHLPARDATVVGRLRQAGAIVLGKTNTPELTMGSGTENPIHGRTYNPYDVSRAPAGSSGGAAAIVAAGGSALDIGSDTGGSIRNPAHVCGVAGLKPTAGRVPLTGHVISFDFGLIDFLTQVGPIARYVEDLDLVLNVIAGPDEIDPTVVPVVMRDFRETAPKRLRVAWFTSNGRVAADPEIAVAAKAAAAALADAGAEVTEIIPPLMADVEDIYGRLRDADGASCISRLLRRCQTDALTDKLRARIERSKALDGAAISELFEQMQRLRSGMLTFMRAFDVLVCPPAPHAAVPYDRLERSTYEDWVFQTAFNVTGWPAAIVRAGWTTEGLPVGVQIAAAPWREDLALSAAQCVEDALGGYRAPKLSL